MTKPIYLAALLVAVAGAAPNTARKPSHEVATGDSQATLLSEPASVIRRSNCRFIGGTHAMDYAIYETCLFSDCTVSGKSIAKNSVFRNCDTSGLGDMIDCEIIAQPITSPAADAKDGGE
jgi:hypothetical protein